MLLFAFSVPIPRGGNFSSRVAAGNRLSRRLLIFNDVGMAGLPATAAGVPAPGIDPTLDELNAIGSVATALDWIGAPGPFRDGLAKAIGADAIEQVQLRDVVFIPVAEWTTIHGDIRIVVTAPAESAGAITDAGGGGGGAAAAAEVTAGPPQFRGCSRLETGWLVSLRRIARLRLALTAHDPSGLAPALAASQSTMADVPP